MKNGGNEYCHGHSTSAILLLTCERTTHGTEMIEHIIVPTFTQLPVPTRTAQTTDSNHGFGRDVSYIHHDHHLAAHGTGAIHER